ncbi:MAG: Rrf2 family transcriptional regulator [Proteobacteria bacterium]|jgi:Rrf2 family iron-sulfur cluster assembly transcriptional regulator|nr:Rrf2 family transcriptional regulator [Pseudomonadota bacterium]
MKLTTKGKFAVTALLDMALNCKNSITPVTLHNISERQGLSLSYLEQLFVKLRRSGLVKSYKGPGGGYVLAKALNELNIACIIQVVDDNMDARACHGNINCKDNQKCLTHDLWNGLTNYVYDYLEKITLQDLVVDRLKLSNKEQIIFMRN